MPFPAALNSAAKGMITDYRGQTKTFRRSADAGLLAAGFGRFPILPTDSSQLLTPYLEKSCYGVSLHGADGGLGSKPEEGAYRRL
jgi:hypothetical protein